MQKTLRPAFGLHFSLLFLGLCACGDAPQHVTIQERPAPVVASPHGPEEPVVLATPHGGTGEEPGEPLYAGTVRLEGALASADTGGIFIIGRQVESKALSLVRKYEIAEALTTEDGSARVLEFSLDNTHGMGGLGAALHSRLKLVVRYDPDGLVESKEGQVETSIVVNSGTLDIALTLPPSDG